MRDITPGMFPQPARRAPQSPSLRPSGPAHRPPLFPAFGARQCAWVALALWSSFWHVTAPATQAAETGPRPSPSVERSLVVGGQGFFPKALRLQDGRIAVVLRGGAAHAGIKGRLDMVFSEDEGRTWTAPAVVVDSPDDDRNPAIGQAKDGILVVGYWRSANYDKDDKHNRKLGRPIGTWVTRSSDGGKSWAESKRIDTSDIGYGSPYGRILTLPDGAMLMAMEGEVVRPAGAEPGKEYGWEDHTYAYRSTDQGQTWTRYSDIGAGRGRFNETALLQLPSGVIVAGMRSMGANVWLAKSSDGGKTWTDHHRVTAEVTMPADLCLTSDGRVLLVVGRRNPPPFGVMGVLGDKDANFDWEQRFPLVTDAATNDCGYPSSVLLKDGRILTVYYATKSTEHPEWGVHCGALVYRPGTK